jgi:hypothetical protein
MQKQYADALAKNRQLARVEGIDASMDKYRLDAIVAPTSGWHLFFGRSME